jgi:hypothetical protein
VAEYAGAYAQSGAAAAKSFVYRTHAVILISGVCCGVWLRRWRRRLNKWRRS